MTAISSNNPLPVSPRTITAQTTCKHWRPSEALSRGDTTQERVWPLLEPSGSLSLPIIRAYQSIGSAYQSNCINGYRQRFHDVINRSDSSNVPSHQVSLELQYIENHSQKGYQVTMPLQYKRTIEQTYYRTDVLSNQVSLRLNAIENQSQENTKLVCSFTIAITISIANRSQSESLSVNDTTPYHDHRTITIRIASQDLITIMISIDIRSEFVSGSENDHDSYQHQKLVRIMILAKKIPSLNTTLAGPNTTLAGPQIQG